MEMNAKLFSLEAEIKQLIIQGGGGLLGLLIKRCRQDEYHDRYQFGPVKTSQLPGEGLRVFLLFGLIVLRGRQALLSQLKARALE